MSKTSKICNFWAISTCNTSKESIFHIEFNFKQKKYDLFQEKLKKSNFFILFSKSMLTSHHQTHVSQICAKKFKNWVRLCFGNVLKLKVTKGELITSINLEMANGYLPGPAPVWLGLRRGNVWFHYHIAFWWATMWIGISSYKCCIFGLTDIET